MTVLKYFFIAFAMIFSAFGWGTVNAQVTKSDYRAIVGVNSVGFDFKAAQAPSNLQTVSLGTNYPVKRIDYEVFSDSAGRLKFFLPPGTVAFNANLYYYLAAQEGKVVLRLNQLPTTPLSYVSPANAGGVLNETVLRNLISGQEVFYYTAGAPANSMLLSSPDSAIAPMTAGGYLYGNFQYPGELLQRGLLQVFVKADCYEQWFNSSTTKWDLSNNPDETATHTCSGSSGGGATSLLGVTVSPSNTLQVGAVSAELTLAPSPLTAALPACTVEGTAHVSIVGDKIKLLPSASNLTSNTTQTIVCGAFKKTITILPAQAEVQVQKSPTSKDANDNLVLNIKLIRSENDVAGKTTASFWIAARIPTDGYFFTEDEWFFLTPQGWKQLALPNPNTVTYQADQTVKLETPFSIPLGLPAADLGAFNVDIHFGYMDAGGVFKNMGPIWSKN